jgi:hypothetical protein
MKDETYACVMDLYVDYHYYKNGVQFNNLNHYGTLKVK